jgi:glycine hydroxymethyltransferase
LLNDSYHFIYLFILHFISLGTPAMTTRGCLEGDFETIAEFLLRAVQIASNVQRDYGKLQKDFLRGLEQNRDVAVLASCVRTFASQFAMPGLFYE